MSPVYAGFPANSGLFPIETFPNGSADCPQAADCVAGRCIDECDSVCGPNRAGKVENVCVFHIVSGSYRTMPRTDAYETRPIVMGTVIGMVAVFVLMDNVRLCDATKSIVFKMKMHESFRACRTSGHGQI